MPTVLGDIYQLHDNYVRVFMLPHKVWENAENEQEALKQAVVIGTEHKAEMDNLVEDMCEANSGLTEELPASDPDMIYHLFFEKEDGQIIHCWLLEDGYLYYHNKSEICLILDRSTYATIFKILATYW